MALLAAGPCLTEHDKLAQNLTLKSLSTPLTARLLKHLSEGAFGAFDSLVSIRLTFLVVLSRSLLTCYTLARLPSYCSACRLCSQLQALVPLLPRAKCLALCTLTQRALRHEVRLTKPEFQLLVRHILGDDIVVLQSLTASLCRPRSNQQQKRAGPHSAVLASTPPSHRRLRCARSRIPAAARKPLSSIRRVNR
eukprot:1691165-Pleurochrysis_carterae.AAC.2